MSAASASMQDTIWALVATTRYLLLVDLHDKTVTPLENHRPEYYGISWFPGDRDPVLSHSAIDNESLRGLADYALSEVGYLTRGVVATPGFLSAPHQILCAPDGKVICCNTGRNAIAVLDPAHADTVREVRLSPPRWDRLAPTENVGDHLNSIFLKDDLLYVVAHGHDKGASLATLQYPDLRVVARHPVEGKTGLHNIWVTGDGQRIGCDSEAASVIDLDDGGVLWNAGAFVYTRGLAASDEIVVVGESARSGRDLRGSSTGGLWLLDRRTWKTLDYISLGPYGAVNEVRLLNVPDHAHHGHCFAGLEDLLQRDLRREVAAQRKADAELAWRHRDDWADYRFVFGVALRTADGALSSAPGSLCLLCEPVGAAAERALDFHYALNEGESHVAVVSYRGNCADSDMHALLIQATGAAQARMNRWTHDGNTWVLDSAPGIGGLPIAGRIGVRVDARELVLTVDDRVVFACPIADMRLADGRLGIRWSNAIISRSQNTDAS